MSKVMRIELTPSDINAIATKVTELLLQANAGKQYVTTKEAAQILGVTEQTVRRNKDNYKHTKAGDHEQGRLLFLRSSLVTNK